MKYSKSPYSPIDIDTQPEFQPTIFREKRSIVIPSQGDQKTPLLLNEGEMAYEQRQLSLALGDYPGIFVTRRPFPDAELKYIEEVLSSINSELPKMIALPFSMSSMNTPLDRIILADKRILKQIKSEVDKYISHHPPLTLQSFHQTSYILEIANRLGIDYYGNPAFAEWAGTKAGLIEFTSECDIPSPLTFRVSNLAEVFQQISKIASAGYDEIIIKLDHSTGGMGHKRMRIGEALKYCEEGLFDNILPKEYSSEEGVVIQGWIPDAESLSLAMFIEFDGTYKFTGAQMHELQKGNAFSAIGSYPLDQKYLAPLKQYGYRIAEGYIRHRAYGPHTMGFIAPNARWCKKLGLAEGTLLANDENSRPGASTIALNWILAIRQGRYGKGWRFSKVKVKEHVKIQQVIEKLREKGLLLEKAGEMAQGVFVFGGLMLDVGQENKFHAISISAADSYKEANEMMDRVHQLFSEA